MTDVTLTPVETEPEPRDSHLWQPKPADTTSSQKQTQPPPRPPVSEPVDTIQISGAAQDGATLNRGDRRTLAPVKE